MNDINNTLDEREKRYGSFRRHSEISQDFKNLMWQQPAWSRLSPCQKEAMEMIAHKIARVFNGDPNYADNWHDIAGYATLVERDLTPDE